MEQITSRIEYEAWKKEVNKNPVVKKYNGLLVSKTAHRFYKYISWIMIIIVIYLILSNFHFSWFNNAVSSFKDMWVNQTG